MRYAVPAFNQTQRVREGGHPVPPERILARYPRTMDNLAQAARLADVAYLYDAMEATEGGPRLLAIRTPTATTALVSAMPAWAQRMLGGGRGGNWWVMATGLGNATLWRQPAPNWG